jgi:hypothetical protein
MSAPDLGARTEHDSSQPTPGTASRSPPGAFRGWSLGRWRWLVPVTVAAGTAAWVAGALSGGTQGRLRLLLIALGAAFTATASGLPLWQYRRASEARSDAVDAAEEARVAMRIALEDALEPIVHVITRLGLAKGSEKARCRGEIVQLTVNTIAALTDANRVRVCFFALAEGPPQELHLDAFAGRAGAPRAGLVAGTATGNAALRTLSQGHWLLLADTDQEPPPFSWDDQPEFRTALIGPVGRPEEPAGMLILDAPGPGEIAHADPVLLHLLAELLAVALSM